MLKFIAVILLTSTAIIGAHQSCNTPDNKKGSCIEIRQCEPLITLLKTIPLSSDDRTFLRNSQCGFSDNTPFVCCPTTIQSELSNGTSKFTENDLPKPLMCGRPATDRLIGIISFGDISWLGLIEYLKPNGSKGFHCGSVLINKNYVLTAAHCINGVNITRSGYKVHSIRLGEWNLATEKDCEEEFCADPVVDIPVAEIIPHENYVPDSLNQEHDIALIRLSRSVKYTDWINPICLPVESNDRNRVYDDVSFEVSGWGVNEAESKNGSKSQVFVRSVSTGECNNAYRPLNISIGQRQLCAGGKEGSNSCKGDSGGSLTTISDRKSRQIFYQYLVGIESFKPKECGTNGWPTVYTKVDQYVDWILSKMTS